MSAYGVSPREVGKRLNISYHVVKLFKELVVRFLYT